MNYESTQPKGRKLKKILVFLAALCLSITLYAQPASALGSSGTVNVGWGQGQVTVAGYYTNDGNGYKTLKYVVVSCAPGHEFEDWAIDGYELQVTTAAGNGVWGTTAANADRCGRIFDMTDRKLKTQYFRVKYYGKARLQAQPDDVFTVYAYLD